MDLALRSIRRAVSKGASRQAAARVACTVLTKAAMDRGSRDNITVVIIDLSLPGHHLCGGGGSHHHHHQRSQSGGAHRHVHERGHTAAERAAAAPLPAAGSSGSAGPAGQPSTSSGATSSGDSAGGSPFTGLAQPQRSAPIPMAAADAAAAAHHHQQHHHAAAHCNSSASTSSCTGVSSSANSAGTAAPGVACGVAATTAAMAAASIATPALDVELIARQVLQRQASSTSPFSAYMDGLLPLEGCEGCEDEGCCGQEGVSGCSGCEPVGELPCCSSAQALPPPRATAVRSGSGGCAAAALARSGSDAATLAVSPFSNSTAIGSAAVGGGAAASLDLAGPFAVAQTHFD